MHVFGLQHKNLLQQLERTAVPSWHHSWQRFQLANLLNQAYGQRGQRKADDSLRQKLHALDVYYLTLKLKESCEALNQQFVLNVQPNLYLMPAIEQLMENPEAPFREFPELRLYFCIYQSLKHPNEDTYAEMEQSLGEVAPLLIPSEARAAYKYAQNFCIRRINRGEQDWQHRLLRLYQKLLSSEIMLEQGVLAHSDFKNIVTLALRLGEFEWTKSFMDTYGRAIDKAHRSNALGYAEALFWAETGQRRKAIRKLNEVRFSDVFYDLSARHLLARTYWEAGEEEALRYHLNAFQLFVSRSKEISPTKKQTTSILSVCSKRCWTGRSAASCDRPGNSRSSLKSCSSECRRHRPWRTETGSSVSWRRWRNPCFQIDPKRPKFE